jgi:SAM-dependent methyltransferase
MARDADTEAKRTSFGAVASEYERARPSYPEAAVDWLVPAGAREVADVGAGTGKLTRALLARGLAVTAVEPSPGMRETLATALPGVTAVDGAAEALPLADDSLDLLTYGQAWHWVEEGAALAEAARVLRPGGTLACIWNLRDDDSGWMRDLAVLIEGFGRDAMAYRDFTIGGRFGPTEVLELPWSRSISGERLIELLSSRSYVIVAAPAERERLFADVRELVATHPELAGRESFEMPYVTRAFRARLAGA